MKSRTSGLGASSTRWPAAVSTIASEKEPSGVSGQWPTTTRTPLLLPSPAMWPRKRLRESGMPPFSGWRAFPGNGYTWGMRLPVPGPRDVFDAFGRGAEAVEALLAAVPKLLALVERADELVTTIDGVAARADALVTRTDAVVGSAEAQVARLTPLLDAFEPSLLKLQPTIEKLADTTDPNEVEALVELVDHLPQLADRMETDVLPMLASLSSVAPDLHDLLAVSRELNDMLAKVPGLGRIKRRIDEEQGEDGTNADRQGLTPPLTEELPWRRTT